MTYRTLYLLLLLTVIAACSNNKQEIFIQIGNIRTSVMNQEEIHSILDQTLARSTITEDDIGKDIMVLELNEADYGLTTNGIRVLDKSYINEDMMPLLYTVAKSISFTKYEQESSSKNMLQFKDEDVQLNMSTHQVNRVIEELNSSNRLADPPMIFGNAFPDMEVSLDGSINISWLAPEVVRVVLNDDLPIGDFQLSSDQYWNEIKELYSSSFERKGLFQYSDEPVTVRMADGTELEWTDANRLDKLWRILYEYMEQGEAVQLTPTPNTDQIIFLDAAHEKIIQVYSNDVVIMGEKKIAASQIYQAITTELTAN